MDDGLLIGNEDLGSTRMRAREARGEVLTGPERRRRWSVEEKLRILAQSVAPGSSVSLDCQLHAIPSRRPSVLGNEDLGSTRMRAREARGEVLTGPERRRRWSVEEKLRILAQSVAPGSS